MKPSFEHNALKSAADTKSFSTECISIEWFFFTVWKMQGLNTQPNLSCLIHSYITLKCLSCSCKRTNGDNELLFWSSHPILNRQLTALVSALKSQWSMHAQIALDITSHDKFSIQTVTFEHQKRRALLHNGFELNIHHPGLHTSRQRTSKESKRNVAFTKYLPTMPSQAFVHNVFQMTGC